MKHLIRKALGGNIRENDIDFVEKPGLIEVTLTNKDKTLHEGNWKDSLFYSIYNSEEGSEDVIAFMQYKTQMNQKNIFIIYVEYLETRNEYRDTKVAMYVLDKFKTSVIEPAIDQYGKGNVGIAANVVNEKLQSYLNKKMKSMGLIWDDGIGSYDLETAGVGNETRELYDKVFNALAEDGSNVTEQSSGLPMIINNALSDCDDIFKRFNLNTIYGNFNVETAELFFSPFDYPNNNKVRFIAGISTKSVKFEGNMVEEFKNVNPSDEQFQVSSGMNILEPILSDFTMYFRDYSLTDTSGSYTSAEQLCDTLQSKLKQTASISNRLRKIAFIGNIQSNDIEFLESPGMIEVKLTNKEKSLNDAHYWKNSLFYKRVYTEDKEGIIGFINYDTTNDDTRAVIYIKYIEIMEEYRQTKVVMYLFDKFKDDVVMPLINQYGKENVVISAEVINEKLREFLERKVKNLGVRWYNDVFQGHMNAYLQDADIIDPYREVYKKLVKTIGSENLKCENDMMPVIKNVPIDDVESVLVESNLTTLYGYCNIENYFSYSPFNYPTKISSSISLDFIADISTRNVKFNCDLIEWSNEINNGIILKSVFDEASFIFSNYTITDTNTTYSNIEELGQKFEEAENAKIQIASRLKKLSK